MDSLWARLAGVFSEDLSPALIAFLIAIASSLMLFDPLGFGEELGLTERTKAYEFWILLSLYLSLAYLTVFLANRAWRAVWRQWNYYVAVLRIRRSELSLEAKAALVLLKINEPDSVQLYSSHQSVRELRNLNAIKTPLVIYSGDIWDFCLSDYGRRAIEKMDFSELEAIEDDERDRIVFAITGRDRDRRFNWMSK